MKPENLGYALVVAIFILSMFGIVPSMGATIYTWNSTDTLSVARNKVNSSTVNLNDNLGISTSTWVVNASGGIMFANNWGGSSTIWATVSTTIPTNNNQLTNGAGYITTSTWTLNASGTNIQIVNQGGSSTVGVTTFPTFTRATLGNASATNITASGYITAIDESYFGVIHATQIYDSNATSTECETADPVTGLFSAGNCVVTLNHLHGNVIATGTTNQIVVSSSTGDLVFSISSNFPSSTIPTPANPSASVGTSATNGTANTYMRSDAAPAINQAATFTFSSLGNTTSTANISASSMKINGDLVSTSTIINFNFTNATGTNLTVTTLKDSQGTKYSTSTYQSTGWTIANDTPGNSDIIKIFPYASTIQNVVSAQNASGTQVWMLSICTSTANATSTDRFVFNWVNTTAQRTATSSAVNGSSTINANDILRIWTTGNTSSSEFRTDITFTTP